MADYAQTHVVPTDGLPAWAGPDGSVPPAANLDPGLDVMVIDVRADWAHIRCSNGWEAWVDNRRLIVSPPAPAAAPPPSPTPAQPTPPSPAQEAPPQPAPTSTQPAPPPPPTQPAPAASPPTQPVPAAPSPTQPVPQAAPPTQQPGPPSAVWGTPGATAPRAPRAASGYRIGVGQILALVGSAIVIASTWFLWLGRGIFNVSAYKTPAYFLLDSNPGSDAGLNLGIIVFVVGLAGIVFALVPGSRMLRLGDVVVGIVALLIALLFIWQAYNLADQAGLGLFDVLDPGPFIAIAGALLTGVGGVLSLTQKSA